MALIISIISLAVSIIAIVKSLKKEITIEEDTQFVSYKDSEGNVIITRKKTDEDNI